MTATARPGQGQRAFLARVEAGLERDGRQRDAPQPARGAPVPAPGPVEEPLADRFIAALEAADGQAIRVPDSETARQAVVECLQAWEARRVFLAHSPTLVSLALAERLHAVDLIVVEQTDDGALTGERGDTETARGFLATADVGITGADMAIAETGTLVLAAAQGHPRMASALPPRHLAVVQAEQIVPTLADVIPRLKDRFLQPDGSWSTSCLSLITGPSRTADIEQTLTVGVHGPRELTVILVGEIEGGNGGWAENGEQRTQDEQFNET